MDNSVSKNKLFIASCISLIVTAMTFAIRAGILTDLGLQFDLNDTQLGYVNSLAFLGFPVATVFGGLLYNLLGARKLMIMAFASHIIGLVMTIYAGGFVTLLVSSFFIGNTSVSKVNIQHTRITSNVNLTGVTFPTCKIYDHLQ